MSADGTLSTNLANGATRNPENESHRRVVSELLTPLLGYLEREDALELCINQPGELFVETPLGWEHHPCSLSFEALLSLAKAVASLTAQNVTHTRPLMSATLPGGERVQIVVPPAVPPGTISLTLRKPSQLVHELEWFEERGVFAQVRLSRPDLAQVDERLLDCFNRGHVIEFLRLAVKTKKNIVISGATGSGKTTLAKSLVLNIPADERLITIEDVDEMKLPKHPNHVRLFYSKGGQGVAHITAHDLLEATLRMKPDRILLSELRGAECFTYLRNVASGHPGSITTCHAGSPQLAFEQLSLMVRQSEGGASLDRADIKSLLTQLIDIIVQVQVIDGRRRVTEVYFDPASKLAASKLARMSA